MSTIAIYVFFFMLIASLLGFLSAYAWKQPHVTALKKSEEATQKQLSQLQNQHENIQAHTNQLEKEKEKLVYENERLSLKLVMLLGKNETLASKEIAVEKDGFIDTSNLDQKIRDLKAQIDKLNTEMDHVKKENLDLQVQFADISKEKEQLEQQLKALRHPRN
ncbi:MAG: hypothetical protein AAF573_16535 [Bacteroidota bacterium]